MPNVAAQVECFHSGFQFGWFDRFKHVKVRWVLLASLFTDNEFVPTGNPQCLQGKIQRRILQLQIIAGVDAIQIFDSLGGLLPAADFEAASGQWLRAIVTALNGQVPVIVYSKGTREWKSLLKTGAHALGIDHEVDLAVALQQVPPSMALQGNLAPDVLVSADAAAVTAQTLRLLELMRGRAGYIFNLGHGVPPEAKMENLQALASAVQNFV